MTKNEMYRRINSMPAHLAARIHSLILARYDNRDIMETTGATRKQLNAIIKWVECYGRIRPQPELGRVS